MDWMLMKAKSNMNRETFEFLAAAIGIRDHEYEKFFGFSAATLRREKTVSDEAESALLTWQETHAVHVEYLILCFKMWHRRDLLEDFLEKISKISDLNALNNVKEEAHDRYSQYFMDDVAKLMTKIEVVMPSEEQFNELAAQGLANAPSYGIHIAAFEHAILSARRDGLRIEIQCVEK